MANRPPPAPSEQWSDKGRGSPPTPKTTADTPAVGPAGDMHERDTKQYHGENPQKSD